ncbi:LGFP repeat-containing protein [Arthrobacter psychrochitiniphilus]|uniref:LGFP repeat-containing protein n=2 Tax=Arthrobacter psychrochitiniphilus TaxID=291045 RepID=UPI001FE356F9|nr:hypothetical protein [Arthrobacter psychrochitiniphilus]
MVMTGWVVSPASAESESSPTPSPTVAVESALPAIPTFSPDHEPASPEPITPEPTSVLIPSPITKLATPPAAPMSVPAVLTKLMTEKWQKMGGALSVLGEPSADANCQDGICRQEFEGGTIFVVRGNTVTVALRSQGHVGPQWFEVGGLKSGIGVPVTDEINTTEGSYQEFDSFDGKGITVRTWRALQGIIPIALGTDIGYRFNWLGGISVVGYPIGQASCGLKDKGCSQSFDTGTIFSSSTSAASLIKGGIKSKWVSTAAQNGILGYPIDQEECFGSTPSCLQSFQGGQIIWSKRTGATIVRGGIRSMYWNSGFMVGTLGLPLSDEKCNLRDKGCVQNFQNGQIAWSTKTGAKTLRGAIGSRYTSVGAQNSYLGYPTAEEQCGIPRGGCKQGFQGGTIIWSAASGARITRGAIGAAHTGAFAGWLGPEGYPLGDEICGLAQKGCYQQFQTGRYYWSPNTRTAVFVKNGIQSRWNQLGGVNGRMGYPIWNEVCANGYCEQQFQHGVVSWAAPGARPW